MTTAATPSGRRGRWPAVVAWTLWALALLTLAAVPWSDHLLRRAGRPDLVQLTPGTVAPILATVSGVTIGAVVATRRPRHPVGWLLLALALSLTATAATAQYLVYGLLVRPGSLPGARWAARYFPATGFAALLLISFILLLTPTGSLPSPRWRPWARAMVGVPLGLLLVVTVAGGRLDPRYEALGGPFDLRGFGGPLLVANQVALAVTLVAVVVAAGSLVGRFRHARGVERQQLRWLVWAAALVALMVAVVLVGFTLGVRDLLGWAAGVSVAVLPAAVGAATLRYRLYDLDRILSRTLTYGLLTLLLGGGYAGVVLGLGQLLGGDSSLAVAAATLAAAAVVRPARRRIQAAVDRRFNRRRYDAAQRIGAFSDRLRQQVDLEVLTGELLAVVEETMQPTQASLWLRLQGPSSAIGGTVGHFQ